MDYEQYYNLTQEAARRDEAGDHGGALAIFQSLIESDLADYDRAHMCYNAGLMLEKLGRDAEALSTYDRGVGLETPICRYLVAEQKAALLHRLGRNSEALSLYRWMESRRWAGEADKLRFRHNIEALSRT